jgi:hypothetical protein
MNIDNGKLKDSIDNLVKSIGGETFELNAQTGDQVVILRAWGLGTLGVKDIANGTQGVAVLTKDEAADVARALLEYANS